MQFFGIPSLIAIPHRINAWLGLQDFHTEPGMDEPGMCLNSVVQVPSVDRNILLDWKTRSRQLKARGGDYNAPKRLKLLK